MIYDLVLTNCKVVKPSGTFFGDIAIHGDKIISIGNTLDASFKNRIDAAGKFVLPGVIDTHVHLGTTDQTFAEAVHTESAAAAVGGVTSALVYRQIPVLSEIKGRLESVLNPDIKDIEDNSLIDIGFHALIIDDESLERIDELVEIGITSFKFLMAYKGEEARPYFSGLEDGDLFRAMERVGRKKGCISLVHAENSEINDRFKRENQHRQDILAWSDSRPSISEEESIRKAIFLAEKAGSPLCIAHVSTLGGVRDIAEAKKFNRYLFQETCPHYLTLTKNIKFNPPALGKVNPPLRGESDVSALWEQLGKGNIDIIGSDHVPYTLKLKSEDLWSARPGLPGIELILPILLSEGVNKDRITIEDIAQFSSYWPSKLFGLYPQKGIIEVGADADLVIVDLDKEVEVHHSILHSASDYSPYDGYLLKGWPVVTIARGRTVFQDGELKDTIKKGSFLRRKGSLFLRE